MDKKSLRILYKQKRLSLSQEQRKAFSASVCDVLCSSYDFAHAQTIHLFLPIESKAEVDTFPILHKIWENGKKAVVSVSDFSGGTMMHYGICADTILKKNSYGIPEPLVDKNAEKVELEDIDMVIVPLLAYDKAGGRVGYGRGFYDRFLSQCRADVKRVGVSFFPPCDDKINDISQDDIPLDTCFTADEVFIFGKK